MSYAVRWLRVVSECPWDDANGSYYPEHTAEVTPFRLGLVRSLRPGRGNIGIGSRDADKYLLIHSGETVMCWLAVWQGSRFWKKRHNKNEHRGSSDSDTRVYREEEPEMKGRGVDFW
ncbi:hypothetical protein JCM24511_02944 [Saitozyma sp. JCM 24511]|nr:hypothetical protein JCM24511_02944 [Saitozyma sp. JCM 24511]